MRINIGCGDHQAAGWLNIDVTHNQQVKPQVIASALRLPFADGSVDTAYLGHVLEHLTYDDARLALAEVRRVVRAGGQVMVVGPDVRRARDLHAQGHLTSKELEEVEYGGDRWATDVHLWKCSLPRLLLAALLAGWQADDVSIDDVPDDWPLVSRAPWQCAMVLS